MLRGLDPCDPYINDIIVGTKGEDWDQLLKDHDRDLRKCLDQLKEQQLLAKGSKAQLFKEEICFWGHLLRPLSRSPEPRKLLALQNWEPPKTIFQMSGSLGLGNYYSC